MKEPKILYQSRDRESTFFTAFPVSFLWECFSRSLTRSPVSEGLKFRAFYPGLGFRVVRVSGLNLEPLNARPSLHLPP